MTLSGKVCQLYQVPPPLFMPVKPAVTPPAKQNELIPGEGVALAKEVTSFQTTPVKATKGTKSDTKYYNLKVNRIFLIRR